MIKEKSAGAVIFFRTKDKIYYLVLRYPRLSSKNKKPYWGFAKGGVEKGESIRQTVYREVSEETSLNDIILIEGFCEKEKYLFRRQGKKIFKEVIFLLAETKTKKIRLSEEHLDFKWLDYRAASDLLTYKNAKNILARAHFFILKNLAD